MWQRPQSRIRDLNGPWYDNRAVGKDTLGNVMKVISESANLSQIYTNHSIRHSVIDILDENNFEARHIMATSGHKSEASIHNYTSRCPPDKRREMSECLAKNLTDQQEEPAQNATAPVQPGPSATISKPTENATIPSDSPDIDWLEVDPNQNYRQ